MSDCHNCPVANKTIPVGVLPPNAFTPRRTVAIIGPPNAGKSTLFNRLTGLRQKVGNFPGVTVEQRVGRANLVGSGQVDLVDLPGVYSLTPRSEDEQVSYNVLKGNMPGVPRPNAILLILDSTNLNRHLVLAAPILSLGLPTLVVLNMADDLERRGGQVDVEALSGQLGVPVVLISAAKGRGVEKVFAFLASSAVQPKPVQLPVLNDIPRCRQWATEVNSQSGYAAPAPPLWTRRLDTIFLHPVAGPLIFLAVVITVFQAMFVWAKPLMDGMQNLIEGSGHWIGAFLPDNAFRSLLIDGVWSGVGSVLVFLPQILLLFFFLGVLEDSGYLARAALIADRTMARVGLQGKSFIPLLSACACAVPAIMSTRTIENKRDRIATILIAPFMTCSARLPVYALIIAAFIPDRPVLGWFLGTRALALLGMYCLGFAAAFGTAKLLRSSVLKHERTPFMLEMPAYRWPTARSIGMRLYDRAKVFIRRAGTVILTVAVVLWVLAHVPVHHGQTPPIEQSVAGMVGHTIEPVIKPLGFNWKIGVGLLTSLAAREVIIGTLGTIYGIEGEATEHSVGLQQALQHDLSLGGAIALLVFFAFAMQCMSTIAVVRRETGSWKWPALQFAYMSFLAYTCAFGANALVEALSHLRFV